MIRAATVDDAAEIAGVLHASFAEYDGVFDPPSGALTETAESVAAKIKEGGCFVVEEAGRIAGCVFWSVGGDNLYLFRLGILPEVRGRGYGRSLVLRIEELAATLPVTSVRLGTRLVEPNKVPFYESLGYEHVGDGTHEGADRPTYAILVKQVSSSA